MRIQVLANSYFVENMVASCLSPTCVTLARVTWGVPVLRSRGLSQAAGTA